MDNALGYRGVKERFESDGDHGYFLFQKRMKDKKCTTVCKTWFYFEITCFPHIVMWLSCAKNGVSRGRQAEVVVVVVVCPPEDAISGI